MNPEQIYNVLLSSEKTIAQRQAPLFGFSYRVIRNVSGEILVEEHGHPTRIVLWEQDGPELADLTEEQVKTRIEEVLSA